MFLCFALNDSAFLAAMILISSSLALLAIISRKQLSYIQLALISLAWGSIFGGSMAFWFPMQNSGMSVVAMIGAVGLPLIILLNLRLQMFL